MAGAEKVVLFSTVDLDFGHLRLVLGRSTGGALHWLLYAPGMEGPGGLSVVSGFCAGEGALTPAQLRAAADALDVEAGDG